MARTPPGSTPGWPTSPATSGCGPVSPAASASTSSAATQGGVDEERRARLVERFELDPTKRVRDYSKGNRQKVALVAALAAEVELLILDEPTSGLDPLMEQAFQDCIRERREEGVTVLLSSHLMAEVEALADRVSIIRRGRNVTTGTLAELRRHTRTHVHAVTDDEPAVQAVTGVEDVAHERLDGQVDTRFTVDAGHVDEVVGRLHQARIRTLTVTPPSLDALFLREYGDALDDAEGVDDARGRAMSHPHRAQASARRTTGWSPCCASSGAPVAAGPCLLWTLTLAAMMVFTAAGRGGALRHPAQDPELRRRRHRRQRPDGDQRPRRGHRHPRRGRSRTSSASWRRS